MRDEGIRAVDTPPPSHSPDIAGVEYTGNEDLPVDSELSDDDDVRLPAMVPAPASSEEELRAKIIKQVEYYFSDENLPNDKFLMKQIKKDNAGFVSISLIGSFRKMKKITEDVSLIAEALKESSQLLVSADGKKVKRLHPLPLNETKDPKSCTIVVENLPEDHSIENIQKIFGQVGSIKSITIHDPLAAADAEQSNRADKLISGRIHAFVEYETVEAAETAVASLNDETDWRNGLRVQLLKKRMGHGLGRKARKGSDYEKASHVRVHVRVPVRDENTDKPNEQHGEPDDEEGEHTSKERNGRRGRNRSKGRKYHGNNGMGHGTTPVEVSKPPPGPRMPDGTRGFTMGRGRPPVVHGV